MSTVPIQFNLLYEEPEYSHGFLDSKYDRQNHHQMIPSLQTLSQYETCRRSLRTSKFQEVSGLPVQEIGKDRFQACIDVHKFAPNELTVKTVDDKIIVEGRHLNDDKVENRQLMRQYTLPEEFDTQDVVSTLTSDGVLTVKVPAKGKLFDSDDRSAKTVPDEYAVLPHNQNEQEQKRIEEYELDEDERG